jgi:spore coat protein U-like protein
MITVRAMNTLARMFRDGRLTWAATLLAPVVIRGADAQTTNSVTPSASVVASCSVPTTATLNFGNYSAVASAANDATTTFAVRCTNTTPFTVSLNVGIGLSATFATRYMTRSSGGNKLAYSLYTNAARTTIWGNGTSGNSTVAGTGTGLNTDVTFTVYGRIPASQNVPTGTYTDTITITVTY